MENIRLWRGRLVLPTDYPNLEAGDSLKASRAVLPLVAGAVIGTLAFALFPTLGTQPERHAPTATVVSAVTRVHPGNSVAATRVRVAMNMDPARSAMHAASIPTP